MAPPWRISCAALLGIHAATRIRLLGSVGARYPQVAMRTLILDPAPAKLEELREQRRRSGLDRLDEVWEGVLHMVPAPVKLTRSSASSLRSCLARLRAPLGSSR
jgi:hypothetical protein